MCLFLPIDNFIKLSWNNFLEIICLSSKMISLFIFIALPLISLLTSLLDSSSLDKIIKFKILIPFSISKVLILIDGKFIPFELSEKTSLAVFVGAFPGAIPFMLGWVAATGSFGIEPGILFMIQFFWQFPHFWAIGWMVDEDYKKAGFKMLPTGSPDKTTAFLIVFYSFWTIVVSILPYTRYSGDLNLSIQATFALIIIGIYFLYFAFPFPFSFSI